MRINYITNYNLINNQNNLHKSSSVDTHLQYPQVKNLANVPMPYFINFKGNNDDIELIKAFRTSIEQTIDNIHFNLHNKFKNEYSSDFLQYIENIKEDDELYTKITENEKSFNRIAQKFDSFNEKVLYSMDKVRGRSEQYSEFWIQNSRIGDLLTADIIQNTQHSNMDINELLATVNDEDYKNIKLSIVKEWLKKEIDNPPKEKIKQTNELLLKKLQSLIQEKELKKKPYLNKTKVKHTEKQETANQKLKQNAYLAAKKYCENIEVSNYNTFKANTIEKLKNQNTTKEQKLEAFNSLMGYIKEKLTEDKGKQLNIDLETIYNIQKVLEKAQEKESLQYASNALSSLHSLAFEKWEKDNIPNIVKTALEKAIFVLNTEINYPEIQYFQNYMNFSMDEKYFAAKYFTERYFLNKKSDYKNNDYLYKIINDRHNTQKPIDVIHNIEKNINERKSIYFNQLDKFYNILSYKKYNNEIQLPERIVKNPNDQMSFIDIYINQLGKTNEFKKKTQSEKIEYLSKLTEDEFDLLNEKIKEDWIINNEKYEILEEVSRQAKITSVFLGMYNKLNDININLDEIKIKTSEFNVSLKNVLENRAILTNSVNEDTDTKLLTQITELQRQYNCSTPEQKKIIDSKISTMIPILAQTLSDGQNDSAIKKQLNQLSNISQRPNPTNASLEHLKTYLMYRGISKGISLAERNVNKFMSMHNVTGHQGQTGIEETVNATDDFMSATELATAGVATAGFASKVGIAKATGITAAIMANPVSAAVVATALIAGITAAVGESKAANLEKGQRELTFYVEI